MPILKGSENPLWYICKPFKQTWTGAVNGQEIKMASIREIIWNQ